MNIEHALTSFLDRYPDYKHAEIEELRANEYGRIDKHGHVYLDYTGGGLHAESQLRAHFAMLSEEVSGNPHSRNPTSAAMTQKVESARAAVLAYFNADPEEYLAIFTPNASGALKLIGESYPFSSDSEFLLTFDNHNSVNGIREFAKGKGASVRHVPLSPQTLRIDPSVIDAALSSPPSEGMYSPPASRLFAYCAQSNFSGVKHPLAWVEQAQSQGWDVLLDAAAFVPTNRLDLSEIKPDFAVLSFYKMFGYPTGIGCLLAKRATAQKLVKPWFAGGTVSVASVQGGRHFLADGEAAFEDGTVNYLGIPAIETGLQYLASQDVESISKRVRALTGWLLVELQKLHHSNDAPMVKIFGPTNTEDRGGTIALAVLQASGVPFDERRIEALAGKVGISLRTGCFCNPGAGEIAHQLSQDEMRRLFTSDSPISFDGLRDTIETDLKKSISSIRVSMGIASNFSDVYRLVEFLRGFKDQSAEDIGRHRFSKDPIIRDVT